MQRTSPRSTAPEFTRFGNEMPAVRTEVDVAQSGAKRADQPSADKVPEPSCIAATVHAASHESRPIWAHAKGSASTGKSRTWPPHQELGSATHSLPVAATKRDEVVDSVLSKADAAIAKAKKQKSLTA